jgi:hypothetical protein
VLMWALTALTHLVASKSFDAWGYSADALDCWHKGVFALKQAWDLLDDKFEYAKEKRRGQ